jgi:tripartite-type tricarboxylate transporter receptor subunit TctC
VARIALALCAAAAWTIAAGGACIAQSNFYEGKTMRIIVGFSPGGGYDALARMLSRHMPKYIPGKPAILVENMTGAGSLLAANHVFKIAKPDGLAMGHFSGGFAFSQVMGQPGIELDTRKFVYVGAVARDESAIALSKASGITGMERWFAAKMPLKLGTTGPGAFGTDNVIKVVKAALNLPIQIISGYKGTADMRLAVESIR